MLSTLTDVSTPGESVPAPGRGAPGGAASRGAGRSNGAWLPWPDSGRPASATEERRFVERLTDRAEGASAAPFDPDSTDWSRRDVTAVVTALRCGLGADELLRRAPGLLPGRLVAAHRAVESRRRDCERAWRSIVADPTRARLHKVGETVAAMLPVVVARLEEQARHGALHLELAVRAAAEQIERVGQLACSVEAWVASAAMERGSHSGGLLYDLDEPGLWDHEHFLPPRVGALVPSRLAALLGERRTTAHRPGA